jgi:hypothetical protein
MATKVSHHPRGLARRPPRELLQFARGTQHVEGGIGLIPFDHAKGGDLRLRVFVEAREVDVAVAFGAKGGDEEEVVELTCTRRLALSTRGQSNIGGDERSELALYEGPRGSAANPTH